MTEFTAAIPLFFSCTHVFYEKNDSYCKLGGYCRMGYRQLDCRKYQPNTHNMPTIKEQIKSKKKMAEIYAVMVKKLNRLISVMPQEVSGDTSDLISTDLTTLNNDIKGIREYLVIKKTSNENMIAICNERIDELKKMPENGTE